MLVPDGQRYRFASETALEIFITRHLNQLWGFDLITRQFQVDGEICDILAAGFSRRPVIIELKNAEDRYVVQQVTRYFHALTAAKPFPDRIDWSLSPELVVLSPVIHRHNLIDRQYCTLPIEFKTFEVLQTEDGFDVSISTLDGEKHWRHPIPYQPFVILPADAPKQLRDWLGPLPIPVRNSILELREKLLKKPDITETVEKTGLVYGNKKRSAMEIRFHRLSKQPVLFCWIPTYYSMSRVVPEVVRHRLWIGTNHQPEFLGHVPDGWGRMRTKEEWDQIPREKWPVKTLRNSGLHTSHTPVDFWPFRRNFVETAQNRDASVSGLDRWSILALMILESW